MRLFIALDFDEITRKKLVRLRDMARDYDPTANFTRSENLHLTLAFLGETPTERIRAAERAIIRAAKSRQGYIPIKLDGAEAFGHGLLCIGAAHHPALMGLQSALTDELVQSGFRLEKREFRPHITLAREFHAPGCVPDFAPFEATARRVSLMKSERVSGKLVYTELFGETLLG